MKGKLHWAIGAVLVLAILFIYAQTAHFDFVAYDDDVYVYKNPHVQAGLTPDSIKWAMTAVVSANWMPVTLLSHMLDAEMFGMQSGMHHMTNVVLHAMSTVLLFLLLRRATHAIWASAFVALIFAVHPLHVGSVAWIAERKDVLSTLLFFLAIYLYERYAEQPSLARYCQMAGVFCLGLMAKPMLVTFPFVLLLLDIWPLRRAQWPKMVWEKLPLFALSGAASVVTFVVQRSSGAMELKVPIGLRIENALVSYVSYLGQMFLPARLAVIYPYAKSIPWWEVACACALLTALSAAAILALRVRPYLTVGWLWYLGTLVPVIGLVQVGEQSHADRYTYIPMVGIAVMIAWGTADIIGRWPQMKSTILSAAAIACLLLTIDASGQAAYWQNSETLFQRAIDVTTDNWIAQGNLGGYLMDLPGRSADAIPHLQAAVRLQPDDINTHNNLGVCLLENGRFAEAVTQFQEVLRLKPDFAKAHFNLALALSKIAGREEEAVKEYRAALRLEPDNAVIHQSLGLLLLKLRRRDEAIAQLEDAVRLNPDYSGEYNLGVVLLDVPGKKDEAILHLEAAQRLHPDPDVAATLARLRGH